MSFQKICVHCQTSFSSRKSDQKFCSMRCHYASQHKLPDKPCERCGKTFHPYSSKSRFCSHICYSGTLSTAKRHWSEDDASKMKALYDSGLSGNQIAKQLGISKPTVFKALKFAKTEKRIRTYVASIPPNKILFTQDQIQQIKLYYEFGLSAHHIAESLGVKTSRPILRILGDYGLTRNKGKSYAKAWRTTDGHIVKSSAEIIVDNWLYEHGIAHIYEPPFPPDPRYRADFFARGVYIEIWGGGPNMTAYRRTMTKKLTLYQAHGLRLINLTWDQTLKNLDDALGILLA